MLRLSLQRALRRHVRLASAAPVAGGDGCATRFPGAQTAFTASMDLQAPHSKRAVFRVMNEQGQLLQPKAYKATVRPRLPHLLKTHMTLKKKNPLYDFQLDDATLVEMYKAALTLQSMDVIFYDAQRQGRISFYMQNTGEEAVQIGSAAALSNDDVIFAQYREAGVLLWRGFGLPSFASQCFSNADDMGKGRQMPVHYGSRAINLQTISSPLATQIPQAAGAAYALKLEGKGAACICYFGEGAGRLPSHF